MNDELIVETAGTSPQEEAAGRPGTPETAPQENFAPGAMSPDDPEDLRRRLTESEEACRKAVSEADSLRHRVRELREKERRGELVRILTARGVSPMTARLLTAQAPDASDPNQAADRLAADWPELFPTPVPAPNPPAAAAGQLTKDQLNRMDEGEINRRWGEVAFALKQM